MSLGTWRQEKAHRGRWEGEREEVSPLPIVHRALTFLLIMANKFLLEYTIGASVEGKSMKMRSSVGIAMADM